MGETVCVYVDMSRLWQVHDIYRQHRFIVGFQDSRGLPVNVSTYSLRREGTSYLLVGVCLETRFTELSADTTLLHASKWNTNIGIVT
jgi:hypothetical protein